jgi:hypothetical protein
MHPIIKSTFLSYLDLSNIPDSHLLDDSQAARILDIKKSTLSVWRCTGRIDLPYIKIGRNVRYRAGDLKAFIASRMRMHTGDGGAS